VALARRWAATPQKAAAHDVIRLAGELEGQGKA